MAENLFDNFMFFDICTQTSERVYLPRTNPFDSYDEVKFRERFRLSKRVVLLLLSEVCNTILLQCLLPWLGGFGLRPSEGTVGHLPRAPLVVISMAYGYVADHSCTIMHALKGFRFSYQLGRATSPWATSACNNNSFSSIEWRPRQRYVQATA